MSKVCSMYIHSLHLPENFNILEKAGPWVTKLTALELSDILDNCSLLLINLLFINVAYSNTMVLNLFMIKFIFITFYNLSCHG